MSATGYEGSQLLAVRLHAHFEVLHPDVEVPAVRPSRVTEEVRVVPPPALTPHLGRRVRVAVS